MKTDISGMRPEELRKLLIDMGEKPFRGKQIFHWIYKGATTFDEMTDLPEPLRQKLQETATVGSLVPLRIQSSREDGTRKYLLELADGNAVESVFMEYKYGCSACISSQAGCRMGCRFCASGMDGLARNLTAGEMTGQILAMEKDTGKRIGNVVVMGTGEPMDNYENLSVFLHNAHEKDGLNLSWRSITVSTCGLIPGIRALGRDFPQVNLAISLHASEDEERSRLMPVNRTYPLEQLLDTCREHTKLTGRRITFEYTLIKGVNDKKENADRLAALLSHMLCHVNLIPLNPVKERDLVGTDRKAAEVFCARLEERGIPATVRRELGRDIDGACGQLRRSERKKQCDGRG